jgi:hypothetical protein
MTRAAAAAILLLFACRGEQSAPPPKPANAAAVPSPDAAESDSLTNFAYGATIASRTGEAMLERSAIAAIDGDPSTHWLAPGSDFPQSITIELAVPSRIQRVGVRAPEKQSMAGKEIVFETSMDGRAFHPLGTMPSKAPAPAKRPVANANPIPEPQWLDTVQPVEAAFLRVTVPAPSVENGTAALDSVLALGRELAPPPRPTLDGCWTVNGRAAAFATRGGRTAGAMQYAHDTLTFDGAHDGRFWRFEWVRGAEFGYAAVAVSPDGQRLNGVQWHEEIIPLFFGDSWFGQHVECGGHAAAAAASADVANEFLKRTGRHSLYALRFAADGTLDADASAEQLAWLADAIKRQPHPRLVAHEFRERSAQANRARAQRALDSLAKALQNAGIDPRRVTFIAAGSDNARQIPGSEAARELYSTVDLEAGR